MSLLWYVDQAGCPVLIHFFFGCLAGGESGDGVDAELAELHGPRGCLDDEKPSLQSTARDAKMMADGNTIKKPPGDWPLFFG